MPAPRELPACLCSWGAQAQHGLEDPILTLKEFRAPPHWQGEVLGQTRGALGLQVCTGPGSQGSVPWAGSDNEKGIMILHKKDAQLCTEERACRLPRLP